jgi:hypothetical protein
MTQKIDYMDVADVVSGIVNKTPVENDDFYSKVEDILYERYEVSEENFKKILRDLLGLLVAGQSPITGETHVGFGLEDEQGNGFFLLKKEV